MSAAPEYGARGRVGLIVPPANTTLEPELNLILPEGVSLHTTRLPGRVQKDTSVGLRERFVGYNEGLRAVSDSFGGAELDALCYGVTGSCYLVGLNGEDKILSDLRAGGAKNVTTASRAISELLRAMACQKIGIVTPYPGWLTELAVMYWQQSGFEVMQFAQLPDVISIYDITIENVVSSAKKIAEDDVDAILLSGTGLPTLRAISQLSNGLKIPVISSNLSLGWWAMTKLPGARSSDSKALKMLNPWLVPDALSSLHN